MRRHRLDLIGFYGMETEPDIVGGPVAVCIAEDRFKKGDRPVESGDAVSRTELVEDTVAKGVKPGFHAVRKRGGTRNEVDGLDSKSGGFEQAAVDGGGREEAGSCGFGVDIEFADDRLKGGADRGDIAMAAHFSDKTSAAAQGIMDTRERRGLSCGGNPMESGVGEDGVELAGIRQGIGAIKFYFNVALASGGNHGRRGIDACHISSHGYQFFGESAISATKVENTFAGFGSKQGNHSGCQCRDEAAMGCIGFGIPDLAGGASDCGGVG